MNSRYECNLFFSFNITRSYAFSINNFMRVEAQGATHILHGWHEQPRGILIFFVTEPDLVGQLKLIVWSMNPVGLHWWELVMCKERHAPTQYLTLTVSKSQPRRWNLTSTSTALQTVVGRLAAVRGNRGIELGAFFWNYLMACLTKRLDFLSLMLRF